LDDVSGNHVGIGHGNRSEPLSRKKQVRHGSRKS
jgi:hypothetical protein